MREHCDEIIFLFHKIDKLITKDTCSNIYDTYYVFINRVLAIF